MSGVQHYALNISRQIKELNPEIKFITCSKVLHEKEANQLNAIRVGKFTGPLWEQLELPFLLKKMGNPLLVNLANTAPICYKNQLNTIHDLAFEKKEPWFSIPFSWYYRWLMPKVAKNCLKLFTVSGFSSNELIDYYGISKNNIKIIPNSISAEMEKNITLAGVKINEKPFLLVVGSQDPRKNVSTVIQAFNELAMPNLQLVIIGRKNIIFKNKELINNTLNNLNIIWKDKVDNLTLVSYYKQAVALINMSFYEGFGLNNLEAMACGCPLVVSSIPVFKEVCQDAAIYIDQNDYKALAAAIQGLIDDDSMKKIRIAKGYSYAKNYSREFSAREIINTIKELGF